MNLNCSASRADGQPCRFPARHGAGLCINHDPAYRSQQAENRKHGVRAATESRQRRARNHSTTALYALDEWALADRSSIQAILDAVIRLELAGRLPTARVRNLLRALSIAVRNFDTPPGAPLHGRTARHDLTRYHHARHTLDQNLEALLTEAEARDAARISPAPAQSTEPRARTSATDPRRPFPPAHPYRDRQEAAPEAPPPIRRTAPDLSLHISPSPAKSGEGAAG